MRTTTITRSRYKLGFCVANITGKFTPNPNMTTLSVESLQAQLQAKEQEQSAQTQHYEHQSRLWLKDTQELQAQLAAKEQELAEALKASKRWQSLNFDQFTAATKDLKEIEHLKQLISEARQQIAARDATIAGLREAATKALPVLQEYARQFITLRVSGPLAIAINALRGALARVPPPKPDALAGDDTKRLDWLLTGDGRAQRQYEWDDRDRCYTYLTLDDRAAIDAAMQPKPAAGQARTDAP